MTKVKNGTVTSEPIHSQRNRPTSVDVAQLCFQNTLIMTIYKRMAYFENF